MFPFSFSLVRTSSYVQIKSNALEQTVKENWVKY